MTRKLETILDNLVFGEGPRWHDGALYFSDVYANEVARLLPDGSRERLPHSRGRCRVWAGCPMAACSWCRCTTRR